MEINKNSEYNLDNISKFDSILANKLDKYAIRVVQLLKTKGLSISTCESCTGGLLSELVTGVSGSSSVFEFGVCTYSEKMKTKILGVSEDLIETCGVVSAEVAYAMALGVREISSADICASVTGIAGPLGGTDKQPVGTVYVSIICDRKKIVRHLEIWRLNDIDRELIRLITAGFVLEEIERILVEEY